MVPAVFDCHWLNCIPGLFCHQHGLANINLEDVLLSDHIKFQHLLTEQDSIVGLEAADDPCIKWLDKGGHVWCKELQLDVGWSVVDDVAAEIINK